MILHRKKTKMFDKLKKIITFVHPKPLKDSETTPTRELLEKEGATILNHNKVSVDMAIYETDTNKN